ncbi:LLM class flavin-dependent oxidoreductase [Arthrobacter sp. JCM 19049]|uniref:LLM class flavin-dependent oxidoreductase n=1 Tax=Arthrobacter sp. JCM 19049 TaxID=1460643 RepID=UPI002795D1E7|nr:LLM class flavin-dependent oxidoreductase [Arthrobacter sp. JCM 19049]
MYAVAADRQMALEYGTDLRSRIAAAGRDPEAVAIMPGLVTYVGRTHEEARAKQRRLNELLPT